MPLTTEFAEGGIDAREDKRFAFTPGAEDGTVVSSLQTVELTLTHPASDATVERTKADFTQDGGEWELMIPFDKSGTWEIDLFAKGPKGYRERMTDSVYVNRS